MRSRYSAYVLKNETYLVATWHPSTRPERVDAAAGPRWTGLRIVATTAGGPTDAEGTVEFVASFRERGRPGEMHERSRFVRENGHWFYLDGEVS
jgi:SEC-C motif-containing protein